MVYFFMKVVPVFLLVLLDLNEIVVCENEPMLESGILNVNYVYNFTIRKAEQTNKNINKNKIEKLFPDELNKRNIEEPDYANELEDSDSSRLFDKLVYPLPDGRIVGGFLVDIGEYPYQLSLMQNGRHICGASLVDFKWAVTAAHCTKGMNVNSLTIRAGSSFRDRGGQLVGVKKVSIHPFYSPSTVDFDVAVMELKDQVSIWSARPIVLPHESMAVPVGSSGTVTGWGALSETGNLPISLRAVTLPIITQYSCQSSYPDMRITSQMFCAGFKGRGGKDSCQGDSGGPLVIDRVLIGIVSWGYGCARPQYPGVYTFVPSVIKFIRSTMYSNSGGGWYNY